MIRIARIAVLGALTLVTIPGSAPRAESNPPRITVRLASDGSAESVSMYAATVAPVRKATLSTRLAATGELAAAFDNEPTHINGYKRAFPSASVVHLDTDHSGRKVDVLDAVPYIVDFVVGPA